MLTVKEWGLKSDDVITVKGTYVFVPKPSREHLVTVKTGTWHSEKLAEAGARVLAGNPDLFSPIVADENKDASAAPAGKQKLSAVLGAKEKKSRWDKGEK